MIPVVIKLQSHSSYIDILRDNTTNDYSIPFIHQWRLLICIAVYNGSNNTVGELCYSARQAVNRITKSHIGMVSCVHRVARFGQVYLGTLISRLNVSL